MALSHSPQIVTSGLAFYYDMANTQKSWRGRPTTNFVNATTTAINRYNNPGFSGSVFNTGQTFRGAPVWETVFIPQDASFIPRLASGEGFGAFHSMGTSLAVNNRYMASIYFKEISPLQVSGTQGFNNTYSNISGWGQNGTTSTRYVEDGWIRLYSQYLNTSSTLSDNKFWKITFNTTNVSAGQPLRAQWCAPMIEQHDTVYPSTFVNGTRSNTQAILDLTNNNTVTANSLTYANDGTFSFNGTNSELVSGTTTVAQSAYITTEAWVRRTGSNSMGFIIGNGTTGPNGYWLSLGSSGLTFSIGNGTSGFQQNAGTISNDTIHHVCGTYDGTSNKIYVNGSLVATNTSISGPINYTSVPQNFKIGNLNGSGTAVGRWFLGNIYAAKIYNRALTAAEVQQNFNALRGRYGI